MLDHPNKICGQVTSTRDFCTYKKKHTKFSTRNSLWVFAYAFPTVKQRPITIMYLNGTRRCYAVGLTGECVCVVITLLLCYLAVCSALTSTTRIELDEGGFFFFQRNRGKLRLFSFCGNYPYNFAAIFS